jgi:transposase
VRWAEDHAVAEVLHLGPFDEDDLYAALDDLCTRQQTIEKTLYQRYLQRRSVPPALFLYDVTSSYLEGEQNALGEYGYNRDGKRGKLQIVIGLLADEQGEPLAVRVFAGNTGDPATVAEQIRIVKEQFGVQELVFVGDRGMVKSKGKQALQAEGLRYISALTDPRIRKLLSTGTLQMSLFAEQVCEVEADGVRFVLRKNEAQAARHKLAGQVDMRVEGRTILLERKQAAIDQAMQLAGCYAVVTDVPKERMNEQSVHDTYVSLQKVERDFRLMKTGPLEVRPLFVRKESRTRGHVFCCMLALKLSREIERRLQAAFGTTDTDPHACTVPDAMAALQVHLPEK